MALWWRRRVHEIPGIPEFIPEFPDPFLAPGCNRGEHDECSHILGFIEATSSRISLCPCFCHESCPVHGFPEHMEWMLSCTCPGHVQIRRRQEQAGLDLAQVAQFIEGNRGKPGDPDWVKKLYIELYGAAAAREAGKPSFLQITSHGGSPQRLMNVAVTSLVGLSSVAETARLLGMTEAQVSAMAGTVRKADR